MMEAWEEGWNTVFTAGKLSEEDINRIIYIRNDGMTVSDTHHQTTVSLCLPCGSDCVCM